VGLGPLKTTPPSQTVKGEIFPVSNTDVVEIFYKPIKPTVSCIKTNDFKKLNPVS
jgi:hypothetical protein